MRQRTVQSAGFLFLLIIVTVAFGVLVANFVTPVFWAAVLAIVFRPVEQWFGQQFGNKRPNSSAALTMLQAVTSGAVAAIAQTARIAQLKASIT